MIPLESNHKAWNGAVCESPGRYLTAQSIHVNEVSSNSLPARLAAESPEGRWAGPASKQLSQFPHLLFSALLRHIWFWEERTQASQRNWKQGDTHR